MINTMTNGINNMTFNTLLGRIVSSPVNLLEMKARLEEKPYRVVDTGIHPKILADWNRKDLLMVKPEPNKMHRFSLTEFVWVKFIEKMREYNFPLQVIKAFREDFLNNSFSSQIEDVSPSFLFEVMKDMDGIKEDPQRFKKFLENIELKTFIESTLPKEVLSGNMLEMFILLSLFLQTPISFFIDHNGKGIIFNPMMLSDGVYKKDDLSDLFSKSFVSISLSEILSEVLVLSEVDILHGQLMLISDAEANVLHALREDELVSVMVTYDKNNQMDLMKVKKLQKVEMEARVMELFMKNGYEEIKMITEGGKIVFCENTRKVKLK